ncbi:MAG: hypothetical protein R6X07_03390 [Desulfatiglandales bacterium]|jgi:hypothetical protein
MNRTSAAVALPERVPGLRGSADRYYSAEFLVEELGVVYQFKIWDVAESALSLLVNEKSGVLDLLKVGDTLRVKYYSKDSVYQSEYQKTAVRHITKNDEGRLKGHFLIGLEILESVPV